MGGGLTVGLVNGFLIAKTHIPALIVTLGTLGIALGTAQLLAKGVDIAAVPAVYSKQIGFGSVLGVPVLVLIAFAVIMIFYVVLSQLEFGDSLMPSALTSKRPDAQASGWTGIS